MSTRGLMDMTPGRIVNLSRMLEKESRAATPRLSVAQGGDEYPQYSRVDRLLEEIGMEIEQLAKTKEGREFEGLLKRQMERVEQAVKAVQQVVGANCAERKDEPYFTADWQQFERAWERETRSSVPVATSTSLESLLKEREQLEQEIKDLYHRDPYYRTSS